MKKRKICDMIKNRFPLIWLVFVIATCILSSCSGFTTKPEEALWGKWAYTSSEGGNLHYASDLEFLQDRKLIIQGREAVTYDVIAPGRMKVTDKNKVIIVNYDLSGNDLILSFDQGSNYFIRVIDFYSTSNVTEENDINQKLDTQKLTPDQNLNLPTTHPTAIPTSPPNIESKYCSERDAEEDPLCFSSWPIYGHNPGRTSWNKGEQILTPPLNIAWVTTIDNYFVDDISVSNNMILLSGMDSRDYSNKVFALDKNGNKLWSYSLEDGSAAMDNTPGLYQNNIYFGGQGDDCLYAVDSKNGEVLWKRPGLGSLGSVKNLV